MVDQVVGRCKTEASEKPVPLDEYMASDLLEWFRYTQYRNPEDWVFASNSNRAGRKRGKQPLWLSTVMRYHIQPVVRKLGIKKRVSWHTFRHTYSTLLKANGEDVKVVLRHGSSRSPSMYTRRRRCLRNGQRNRKLLRWCGRMQGFFPEEKQHRRWVPSRYPENSAVRRPTD